MIGEAATAGASMDYRHIQVIPIAGALGAEIRGVDLARPLVPGVFHEIHRAFLEHLVIFFHDQALGPDHLTDFARRFGPLGRYPFAEPLEGHREVIPIIKEPDQLSNFGGLWHSDTAYQERPSLGSLLYALEVPSLGGDTLFANMYLAYERLSEGLKTLLAGSTSNPLTAVNSAAKNQASLRSEPLAGGAMTGTSLDPATLCNYGDMLFVIMGTCYLIQVHEGPGMTSGGRIK